MLNKKISAPEFEMNQTKKNFKTEFELNRIWLDESGLGDVFEFCFLSRSVSSKIDLHPKIYCFDLYDRGFFREPSRLVPKAANSSPSHDWILAKFARPH